MTDIQLSPDQQDALDSIVSWYRNNPNYSYLTLGGYAGSGKTTLISEFAHTGEVKLHEIAFVAYTGKAVNVMRKKLKAAGLGNARVSTIHRLIYIPRITIMCRVSGEPKAACPECKPRCKDENLYEITSWERRSIEDIEDLGIKMIILDEASMVDRDIWNDLGSYGLPILAVGDHGQLPPIGKDAGLMLNPMIRLEKVHRQAENSPVIKMATYIRTHGHLPHGDYGDGSAKVFSHQASKLPFNPDDMVLCAMNRTRLMLTTGQRRVRGFGQQDVEVGEKIMALRNDYEAGLFNGMTGIVTALGESNDTWIEMEADMEDGIRYKGRVLRAQFHAEKTMRLGDKGYRPGYGLFTHAYVLSVHKAQGSQADSVLVFEERLPGTNNDHARWLYTAVTRAAEKCVVIG